MVLLLASVVTAGQFKYEYRKEIPVSGELTLSLENIGGDITITGDSVGSVNLSASKIITAESVDKAEELNEFVDIDVVRNGTRIEIKSRYLERQEKSKSIWDKLFGSKKPDFASVTFTMVIPYNSSIEIENGKGGISLGRLDGDINLIAGNSGVGLNDIVGHIIIDAGSGKIEAADIVGDIDLISGAANLQLENINGAVNIKSASGDKELMNIDGDIKIEQGSGLVKLNAVRGYVNIRSGSGNIEMDQISGHFNLETGSGVIVAKSNLESSENCLARSSSGTILLKLPEKASASLDLRTETGRIDLDFPMQVETVTSNHVNGVIGKGGPEISVLSESGNIKVEQIR